MKSAAPFLFAASILAAILYSSAPAVPAPLQGTEIASSSAPGRFTLHGEDSERILLDTATGDTWKMRSSTALADAQITAWLPLSRVRNEQELEAWLEKATDRYNAYVARLHQHGRDNLDKKIEELGEDHPSIAEMKRFVLTPPFPKVSVKEMRAMIEQQR